MPEKIMRMKRANEQAGPRRPVMLAIAGDSAAGKTTLADGIVEALGHDRCLSICVDDYHRYDRNERKSLPFTALHPDCNYIDIMEHHLQALATGQPILKPVYDHSTGMLTRPEYIKPTEFIIVEGLLPLYTKLARACFDVMIYLNPPEEIRRAWKLKRDTGKRGYDDAAVQAELERREPESAKFIRPQRMHADIVVRFAPIDSRNDPPDTPLSAELMLRPTIRHPDLSGILESSSRSTIHLKLTRDEHGRPVDTLHVHGYAPEEDTVMVKKAIWSSMGVGNELPPALGTFGDSQRSEPLAITQLLALYHVLGDPR
jgi:phosphoribulokinase